MSAADVLSKVLRKSSKDDEAEDRPPPSEKEKSDSYAEYADIAWDAAKDGDRAAFDKAFRAACGAEEEEE